MSRRVPPRARREGDDVLLVSLRPRPHGPEPSLEKLSPEDARRLAAELVVAAEEADRGVQLRREARELSRLIYPLSPVLS